MCGALEEEMEGVLAKRGQPMNLRIEEKEPINPLPRRRDKPVERIIL